MLEQMPGIREIFSKPELPETSPVTGVEQEHISLDLFVFVRNNTIREKPFYLSFQKLKPAADDVFYKNVVLC